MESKRMRDRQKVLEGREKQVEMKRVRDRK
jgi:hypothetical protein